MLLLIRVNEIPVEIVNYISYAEIRKLLRKKLKDITFSHVKLRAVRQTNKFRLLNSHLFRELGMIRI